MAAINLQTLLEIWRRTHDPRVADLLDLAGERTDGPESEFERTIRSMARANASSEENVGAADAASFLEDAPRDDPRVASALVRFLDAPAFLFAMRENNGVREFWNAVLAVLGESRDIRAVEAMERFAGRVRALAVDADEEAEQDMYTAHAVGPYLHRQMRKVAESLRSSVRREELTQQETAFFARAVAEYAPEKQRRDERHREKSAHLAQRNRLLMAVVERPNDDAPRLAFADFLGDDPRAEFIRAQVRRHKSGDEPEAREAELVDRHAKGWLGDAAHLIDDPVFERGFLRACALNADAFSRTLDDLQLDDPLWGTLERITCVADDAWTVYDRDAERRLPNDQMHALVSRLAKRSLTDLDGVTPDALIRLVGNEPLPFEHVTLEAKGKVYEAPTMRALGSLPSLRTLRFRFGSGGDVAHIRPLLAPGILGSLDLERVDLLVASRPPTSLPADLFNAMDASGAPEVRVIWTAHHPDQSWGPCELALSRDAEGCLGPMRIVLHACASAKPTTQYWVSSFVRRLDEVPPDLPRSFEMSQGPGVDVLPSANALAQLKASLERFTHLRSTELLPAGDSEERIAALIVRLDDASLAETTFRRLESYRHPAAREALLRYIGPTFTYPTRAMALCALAQVLDDSCAIALKAAMDGTHAGWMASELVGFLRDAEAGPDLVRCYESHTEEWARTRIAQSLGRVASPEAGTLLPALYEERPTDDMLFALARSGSVEARALALAALAEGRVNAIGSLALVGAAEDSVLLDEAIREGQRVSFIAGIPLLAKMNIAPRQTTPEDIEGMCGHIDKTWSSGINELGAWLLLALRARLPRALSPEWKPLGQSIATWAGHGRRWSQNAVRFGLEGAHWNFWDGLRADVEEAWGESA